MIPALCRWWRRLRAQLRWTFELSPLDEEEWQRAKAEHPVTFLRDTREPHLESDRRVDESYASSVTPMRDPYRWRPGDPL